MIIAFLIKINSSISKRNCANALINLNNVKSQEIPKYAHPHSGLLKQPDHHLKQEIKLMSPKGAQ